MSDKPIEKMNFEELRREVQVLSDKLAKMKRFYEDALENLDDDNFSKAIIKEKDGMKAQIKISAEEISTKVSKDDFAEYSEISQTAKAISTLISKNVNLSDAIVATSVSDMTDTSKLYYIQVANVGKVYYYYNTVSSSWEVLSGDSITSIFEQTATGFKFKGGVQIDGNQVVLGNLTLGGNITWDLQNSPVQTQYSSDGTTWHTIYVSGTDKYMHMSFDGGTTWSNTVQIVGQNGSDASVTPQNVFNALTDSGAQQGIFAAFVKGTDGQGHDQLYINSEMLATRIATVADTLFIGNTTNANGTRKIILTGSSNSPSSYIATDDDGMGGNGGLRLSSALIHLQGQTRIEGLLDLTSQSCSVNWGNITVPAVFG